MRKLFELCLAASVAGYASLMVLGVASWRRPAVLRAGRWAEVPRAGPAGAGAGTGTHPVTLIPGWTGVALVASGALGAASGSLPALAGGGLAVAGAFVAVTGFLRRVLTIGVDLGGVRVEHRRGHPFAAAWDQIGELRPPRTPLGGWTIVAEQRRCTLMPSDLWNAEAELAVLVTRGTEPYLTMN